MAAPAPAGCADGTAEGGEHTNVALDVDGEEVADEQGSVQGLLIGPQLLGVLYHWQGHGKALIAAARS